MQTTYDLGLTGWLLWTAGSEFTDGALAPEGAENVPNEPSSPKDKGNAENTRYSKNAGETTG